MEPLQITRRLVHGDNGHVTELLGRDRLRDERLVKNRIADNIAAATKAVTTAALDFISAAAAREGLVLEFGNDQQLRRYHASVLAAALQDVSNVDPAAHAARVEHLQLRVKGSKTAALGVLGKRLFVEVLNTDVVIALEKSAALAVRGVHLERVLSQIQV